MSTYRMLAERAAHFDSLPQVKEALAAAGTPDLALASVEAGEHSDALKAEAEDLDALAARGYANEALDQLVVEVLLGVS
jgi:xylose isomerase